MLGVFSILCVCVCVNVNGGAGSGNRGERWGDTGYSFSRKVSPTQNKYFQNFQLKNSSGRTRKYPDPHCNRPLASRHRGGAGRAGRVTQFKWTLTILGFLFSVFVFPGARFARGRRACIVPSWPGESKKRWEMPATAAILRTPPRFRPPSSGAAKRDAGSTFRVTAAAPALTQPVTKSAQSKETIQLLKWNDSDLINPTNKQKI